MPPVSSRRLLVSLAAYHDGPGHARNLVCQCDRSNLDWPALHNAPEPEPFFVPCCRAYRMIAIAPATSSHRRYRLPCLVMLPSRSLPPVVCCFGTSRSRPPSCVRSGTPSSRPLRRPGRWRRAGRCPGSPPAAGFPRTSDARSWMLFSMAPISAAMALYWRAITSRMAARRRGESGCPRHPSMILSNSAVPLRPLADDNAELGHVPTHGVLNIVR